MKRIAVTVLAIALFICVFGLFTCIRKSVSDAADAVMEHNERKRTKEAAALVEYYKENGVEDEIARALVSSQERAANGDVLSGQRDEVRQYVRAYLKEGDAAAPSFTEKEAETISAFSKQYIAAAAKANKKKQEAEAARKAEEAKKAAAEKAERERHKWVYAIEDDADEVFNAYIHNVTFFASNYNPWTEELVGLCKVTVRLYVQKAKSDKATYADTHDLKAVAREEYERLVTYGIPLEVDQAMQKLLTHISYL